MTASSSDREQPRRTPAQEAELSRRLAKVFGEVLPETTVDERGDGWDDLARNGGSDEEWLRAQVPPHHGG